MEGEQTRIPGSEPADPVVYTALGSRIRKGHADVVVRMANHHKVPVPTLAGRLLEYAVDQARIDPSLVGSLLQSEDAS